MQTFLPFPDFNSCAEVLDYKRLGKQRVEAYQILRCIETPNRWHHHPAVEMWRNHTELLKLYMNVMIQHWILRGYKNTMKIESIQRTKLTLPNWLGVESLHSSHRSNLLRKNYDHYKLFGWSDPPEQTYWWPYSFDKANGSWKVNEEWPHSSAGERCPYKADATGSNPVAVTIYIGGH